ncbi:MAG: hypothetical protein AB1589_25060 [Cyanobacteriota bacterium]
MSEQIWNLLHDGVIEKLSGNIPGTVKVCIQISYLRHIFSEDGDSIIVILDNCQKLEYEPYSSNRRFTEFSLIESESPEILEARSEDNDILIVCGEGLIYIRYTEVSLALDTGCEITILALENAARKYWNEAFPK